MAGILSAARSTRLAQEAEGAFGGITAGVRAQLFYANCLRLLMPRFTHGWTVTPNFLTSRSAHFLILACP
jgi:hypothetical protein